MINTMRRYIEQLKRKNCDTGAMENMYPVTILDAIKDVDGNTTLKERLNRVNHIYVDFRGTRVATRQAIPESLRRKGLWITYVDCSGDITTEWYTEADTRDTAWGDDSHWTSLYQVVSGATGGNVTINWYKA